jgi:hypothetical protein
MSYPHFSKEESEKLVAFLKTKKGEIIIERVPREGNDFFDDARYILLDVRGRSAGDFMSTFKEGPKYEDYSSANFILIMLNDEDGSIIAEKELTLFFDWIYYLDKDDEDKVTVVPLLEVLNR